MHQQSKQCAVCTTTFHRKPSRSRAQWERMRFCSARCANKWRAEHCAGSGAAFVGGPGHGQKVRQAWLVSPRGKKAALKQRRKALAKAARQADRAGRLQLELWPRQCADCGGPTPKHHQRCFDCSLLRKRKQRQRWDQQHPDYDRLYKRGYAKFKAGLQGRCTHQQARARFDFYGGRCAYCRVPLGGFDLTPRPWHWDHVIPLSRGGTAWPANLRPACSACNRSKSAQPLETWYRGEALVG